MKPLTLFFFVLMISTAMIFALIYGLYTEIVDTYAQYFSIGLTAIFMIGLGGMMYTLISTKEVPRRNF